MLNELKRTYEYYLLMQPLAFGLCQEYLLWTDFVITHLQIDSVILKSCLVNSILLDAKKIRWLDNFCFGKGGNVTFLLELPFWKKEAHYKL